VERRKEEMLTIIMSRDEKEQIRRDKWFKDLDHNVRIAQKQVARANMLSAKALLNAGLSVEQAKEVVRKTHFEFNYAIGRKRAEELGNPKDIDTFLEEYVGRMMRSIPWVDPCQVLEKTEKRVLWGGETCMYADMIQELRQDFPDTLTDDVYEIMKCRCVHDEGWALGFIPVMKYSQPEFILDGDARCLYDCEVP
jgi:hypothetical protein